MVAYLIKNLGLWLPSLRVSSVKCVTAALADELLLLVLPKLHQLLQAMTSPFILLQCIGFDDYLGFDQILKIKRISNSNQIKMKFFKKQIKSKSNPNQMSPLPKKKLEFFSFKPVFQQS
jgi:hypothetical protein